MSTAQPILNAPSIGQHNQAAIESVSRAKRVAVDLARHGFTVLRVIATNRNARVVIRQPISSAAIVCEAAPIMYTPYDTTYAASVEGVQVEWQVRRVP